MLEYLLPSLLGLVGVAAHAHEAWTRRQHHHREHQPPDLGGSRPKVGHQAGDGEGKQQWGQEATHREERREEIKGTLTGLGTTPPRVPTPPYPYPPTHHALGTKAGGGTLPPVMDECLEQGHIHQEWCRVSGTTPSPLLTPGVGTVKRASPSFSPNLDRNPPINEEMVFSNGSVIRFGPSEVLEAPATASVAPLVASGTSEKELLGDVTGRALRALVVQLDRLEYRQAKFRGVGDVTRHEMAQEAATLARAVSQITDAVRKRESSVREMVANMTPEQRDRLVKAYIEALPPDQLKEWKEWIDGL